MRFKEGDVVECIDNNNVSTNRVGKITIGERYVVERISPDSIVYLKDWPDLSWGVNRFKIADLLKTAKDWL